MNFVSEVFKFYQTDSLSILIYSQVVMIISPIIFLAMSLIDNLRLTHKKIEDKPSRRAYHLKRLLYLMAYIACNVIANLVIYPVMRADVELPTNLVVGTWKSLSLNPESYDSGFINPRYVSISYQIHPYRSSTDFTHSIVSSINPRL